jgi:hypothetical protein
MSYRFQGIGQLEMARGRRETPSLLAHEAPPFAD